MVLSLVFALLDDARALATCACVSRSWRTLAAAERARLRAAYARALGEDEGNVFVDAAFSNTVVWGTNTLSSLAIYKSFMFSTELFVFCQSTSSFREHGGSDE